MENIMRLYDKDISDWLKSKKLIITPYPKKCIKSVTIDIYLSNKFRTFYDYAACSFNLNNSKQHISALMKKIMSEETLISHQKSLFCSQVC